MRKLAFGLLWVYVLSIPLERVLILPGIGTIAKILGACAFAAGVAAVLRSGTLRRPAAFHLLFLGFVFWGLLSYVWSIDPDLSWPRMLNRAQLPLMILLIWELAQDTAQQRSLMQAYCFGVAIVCVQIVGNYVNVSALLTSYFARYSAFDVDPNMTALRIALSVPMAIYLTGWSTTKWLRWFYWALVPLAVLSVVLTGSRSGALALMGALLFLPAAFTAMSRTKKLAISAGVVVSSIVLYSLISPALLERIMTIPGEIQKVMEGDTLDANIRIRLWGKGLAVVPEHLLGGVGIGAFRESVAQDFRGGLGMSAHNTFLSILVEEGVIGFCLFMGSLGALALGTRGMAKVERRLCLVLMLTWSISVFFIQQHEKQHTWFVMGVIAAQGGSAALRRSAYPAPVEVGVAR